MITAGPTFSQIKAQVAAVREKVPHARVIGISAPGRWAGQRITADGEQTYMVCQCDSPLAMRLALREKPDDATAVLVTGLDDSDLDDDIRVRLAKRQLIALNSWQIVKSLFEAHTIDPRIGRLTWMAEELMSLRPPEGYAPTAGGVLDADRAWGVVLKARYGLPGGRPDLAAVLRWSMDPESVRKWQKAPDEQRTAATEWVAQINGPVIEPLLACVGRSAGPEVVPVGLASRVVFAPEVQGQLDKARGRMEERYFGGDAPAPAILDRWHRVASELVREHTADSRQRQVLLARTDEILEEVGASDHAHLSDVSPLGFDQRFARFGQTLERAIQNEAIASVEALNEARNAVLGHALVHTGHQHRRVERMQMALRLVRWLQSQNDAGGAKPTSLAEAAGRQRAEHAYVDWARWALRTGDPDQVVSRAYHRLFERVRRGREADAAAFADLLRDWTGAGASSAGVLAVESVLGQVVAPLAEQTPVLVVVIDGMSTAVWRELMSDLTSGYEWASLVPESEGALPPAIAAIPSVTEISRASLLCGHLARGASTDEKKGFGEHPDLLRHCRSGSPPVLFHKAAVQESDEIVLEGNLRHEIASSHRRVVGVVVNAVDDHLLKGEQLDIRWTRDAIRVLPALLYEARMAGRCVVLVSDHGHVLDQGTTGRSYDDAGERWRPDNGHVDEGERRINGERVLGEGNGSLIAPWSEALRYGMKKNGYHGGLNPQEMVVPVAVLCAGNTWPKRWAEAPVEVPLWWDQSAEPEVEIEQPTAPKPPETPETPATPEEMPGPLFQAQDDKPSVSAEQGREAEGADQPKSAAPGWIDALLESPLFTEQKKLGGRAVPDDAVFAQLLTALDQRGGKMTSTALSRMMQRPPHRLAGLLAAAQRVLNIDGYHVLNRDEASQSVELNAELLRRQFGLD